MEKWIFHKLNIAAIEINQCLTDRNFMAATNAVYNFWLYELCDVYIVSTLANGSLCQNNTLIGSNETHDRRISFTCYTQIRSADTLHVPRLWLTSLASFHALCDRRALATFAKASKRSYAIYHAGIIPHLGSYNSHARAFGSLTTFGRTGF